MNSRAKKFLLLLLAAALLFGSSRVQNSLNADRDRLGMTYTATLDDAPPVLAFTTIALGGFRGLISNFLWIRANDLQQDDKFFEAAQLATWITDLEPHFTQVWLFQGWNMAYNISVKFKENSPGVYADRWRWVENGISLLRDQGLKYNPDDVLIHRELAWFFQHKIGANLDDANMYYKSQWATNMMPFFGPDGTNYQNLVSPQTPEDRTNAMRLRQRYKLDPAFIKVVDDKYGPFDWRLPEAHAIYWGAQGLELAKKYPDKVKEDDLITLRRIIYQSIYQAFKHGRILINPFTGEYSLGPNLSLVSRVNEAYSQMADEDEKNRVNIEHAQRNFLRDAVYFLYEADRTTEARQWFDYLGKHFPNMPIVDGHPESLPGHITLDEYAVARVQEDIGETSQERVTAAIQGLLLHAYMALVADSDDSYQNLKNLADRVYKNYDSKTADFKGKDRIPLRPYPDMVREVVSSLLDPQRGLPYDARAVLRTRLGLPAESVAPVPAPTPAIGTNSPPAPVTTNAPAQ
jgi:hypothetical protein